MRSTESRERELLQPHTAQQKRKHESRKKKVRNASCYRTEYSRLQRNFRKRKIYAILKDRGYAISESTVAKIMHENGMFSIRACAKTLYKQHQERKANILQQQFQVFTPE